MTAAPDLEAAVRAVEPAARLVSARRLLKVLLYLRDHGHAVPANPDLPHWVSRDHLLAADVLPRDLLADHPRLLLLTAPDDRMLGKLPVEEQLRVYWRLLFQAAVQKGIDGTLTPGACADRLMRFGPAAVREIRYVLETDHLADPDANPAAIYQAFAAAYLDLHCFAPAAVEEFFPGLPAPHAVVAVVAEGQNLPALLAQTRPAGAADPVPEPAPDDRWCESSGTQADAHLPPGVAGEHSALLRRADDAERKGNEVRAAILRTQTACTATSGDRERAADGARAAVGRLVQSLAAVLHWDDETQQEWRQALAPLLVPAAGGVWPRAARCLYELQKIPADLSREVYAVDLVEYLRTFGRRPVKRPLPHARTPMLLVRLRAAHRQLLRSGLGEQAQLRLDRLFHHEAHRLEHAVRHDLTPILTAALEGCGFRPANRVEEVAREKVVAELLDRVCERGFLRLGDLRDAVARNQLKMPDLAGPVEFLTGDPLLRADARLAYDLDGVYRRGEFYLRWLQRASAVFFGTPWGRVLTLYVIAPLLAAFLILMTAEELRHLGGKLGAFASKVLAPKPPPAPDAVAPPAAPPVPSWWLDEDGWIQFDPGEATTLAKEVATASPPEEHHGSALVSWPAVLGLAVFLFLMFHAPPVRRAVFAGLASIWRVVRVVVWDVPHAVAHSAVVRAVRYSRVVRFAHRRLGGALLLTAGFVLLLWFLGAPPRRLLSWGGVVFALAVLALNTPWGWVLRERVAEQLADWWRVVRGTLLPGLVATIIDLFKRLANWVERQLYAVDEWLRYRGGDSQGSLALKAVLGLLWFPVAYLARFAFYLLIEPQINPVKHFPVVTVSHKVILPMTPSLADALRVSDATAAGILACIPGVFGFAAWELLANWQLYRANRPDRLKPVMIGSHGETMRGLLRPGFHSGTVPTLFRKLRAADRRGDRGKAAHCRRELEHAAEAVHRFVERELVWLLGDCPGWGGVKVEVTAVRFGCQRVVVELAAPALGRDAFALAFENRDGRVGAAVEQAGWSDKLSAAQRAALLAAVRGVLDMAAAELFDDRDRGDEKEPAGAYAELLRPYTWAEWVVHWDHANPGK